MKIISNGWYAVRFIEPSITALNARERAIVAISRRADPVRTWAFRLPDDSRPMNVEQYFVLSELIPENPYATTGKEFDHEDVGFDLTVFDDLGFLGEKEQ